MYRLKTFLHALYHSLFPFDDFYVKIRHHTSFQYSVRYVCFLYLLLVTLFVSVVSMVFIIHFPQGKISTLTSDIEQNFPDDLIITINKSGRLMTNYDRPIILFSGYPGYPKATIVIDYRSSKDAIENSTSALLLSERYVTANLLDTHLSIPYEKDKETIITKAHVSNIVSVVNTMNSLYPIIILIVALFSTAFLVVIMLVSKAIYLVILAGIIFCIERLFSKKAEFKKTYQISMHAITGPIIIEFCAVLFGLQIPVEIWFFLLSSIFICGALYESYLPAKKA